MAVSTVSASSLTSQEDSSPYSAEIDIIELAREAVRAGLIKQDVLDHLTSLQPQVPSSLKHRYFLMQLREEVRSNINDELFFARMVQVLVEFQPNQNLAQNTDNEHNITFGPEHIPELLEFLVEHAYKWEFIGTALKFKPQDLRNIKANNNSRHDFVMCNLMSLLEEWIGKKYRHTLPPTMGNLKRALNSQIVGLGALACELGNTFVPQDRTSKTLPYLVVSVDILETTENSITCLSTHTQHMNVHAKENESVLLEMQCTSHRDVTPQYQWQKDNIPIQENEVHTGTTTPVLCISNADIDMDGFKYNCDIYAPICTEEYIYTEQITLRVDCPLDVYTHSLAAMYSAQPEVPKDTWPPVSSKKYINLALIRQKQVNYGAQYAHLTIRGDMDDILQHKEVIEYDQVFQSLRCGQVIFIEGRPGSGKTTFVHKITRDWAITSNGGMRLVLLVSLRVLNNLYKSNRIELSDILNLFMDLKVSKKIIEKRNGKGVCFIFDGLDEFLPPDGENSIVHRIIHKKYLSQSTVIVASRPAAIAELRQRANKVIEVVGFKKEQIFEYFNHYPFSNKSKSTELKAYLSVHLNILHMCYLPVHAAMIGFLFEVTGEVPQTEAEIYKHFTHFTLKRNLTKCVCANLDVRNLSGEEEKIFNQICKLALNKTILNRQVMHQDEVTSLYKSEKDGDISLGLITIDRTADLYGFKDLYTFLHLTFQEYLAAHHISTLSDEEQDKLIQEHGNKNHMLAVWKFYCGLVEFGIENKRFKSILRRTSGKYLFHIQCAYESQQSLPCTQLLKSKKYHIRLTDKYLTIPDYTAMGYIMNISVMPVKLSLKNCKINIEAIDAMLLQMTGETRCLLQTLNFESCDADMECVKKLLINVKSLKKLTLKTNNRRASIDKIQALAEGLKSCTELKELDISNNGIWDGETLATGLTSCRNLERICIRNNGLSTDGVRAIFKEIGSSILKLNNQDIIIGNNITDKTFIGILQHCTNLQSLETQMEFKDISQFLLCSLCWKSLKELKVDFHFARDNDFKIMVEISNCLQNFSKLQKLSLDMGNYELSDRGADSLAEGFSHCLDLQVLNLTIHTDAQMTCNILKHCVSLKELHLSNCGTELCEAIRLSSCPNLQILKLENCIYTKTLLDLGNCTQLNQLHLGHNSLFNDDDVKILAANLYHYPQLKELDLCDNKISDNGAMALAANLHHCTQLTQFNLSENLISENGANALVAHIHHCTQLKKFDLGSNNISRSVAMALAAKFQHLII